MMTFGATTRAALVDARGEQCAYRSLESPPRSWREWRGCYVRVIGDSVCVILLTRIVSQQRNGVEVGMHEAPRGGAGLRSFSKYVARDQGIVAQIA